MSFHRSVVRYDNRTTDFIATCPDTYFEGRGSTERKARNQLKQQIRRAEKRGYLPPPIVAPRRRSYRDFVRGSLWSATGMLLPILEADSALDGVVAGELVLVVLPDDFALESISKVRRCRAMLSRGQS